MLLCYSEVIMSEKRGKFIVIEGGDGSGKATQAEFLVETLRKSGEVTYFDFPQYETSVWGALVGQCLAGEFGDFLRMSPYLSSLPYSLDRASAKDALIAALQKGHVVCNRYTPSNIAYQSAKLPDKEQESFISFIERGEYDEIGLPRPDMVIYLDVSSNISSELILQKAQRSYLTEDVKKDQHEQEPEYQDRVARVYRKLAAVRLDWHSIPCTENGTLLSRERIKKEVESLVHTLIP